MSRAAAGGRPRPVLTRAHGQQLFRSVTTRRVAEVEALGALGATRVVVPAAMFGTDPDRALMRYGENVIGRFSV